MPDNLGSVGKRRLTPCQRDGGGAKSLQFSRARRLRVIDASVMPTHVRGHTHAAVVMIGEKGADLILGRTPA